MKIKEVKARIVLDSRGEKTIEVSVNKEKTIAPSGKSKGKYEKPSYSKSINQDVCFINQLKIKGNFEDFLDLEIIEEAVLGKIGANSLYALEASILKAIAKEKKKELWRLLNPLAKKFPRILSNTIGGGAHANISGKKTDFQEYLVVCNKDPSIAEIVNNDAYKEAQTILRNLTGKRLKTNDENAWISTLDRTLEVMKDIQESNFEETGIHIDIGLDCAASQLFKNNKYYYKNDKRVLTRKQQIDYLVELAKKYDLFYLEDPLDEEDFKGFSELVKKTKRKVLIVGDDLTTTNLERVKKAIKMNSITGLIVKPNQIGSLLEVKKVIDLCKENNIFTIISHRSGESVDSTIADLGFAWQVDFIKIPVIGKERLSKVNRLIEIEKSIYKKN